VGRTTEQNEPTAVILEIQRMSTEDGPGLRTTVFFKGCSLKCAWCHNPESLAPQPQTQWLASRCLGCKLCLAACPNGALTWGAAGPLIDRARCQGCGACAAECPSTAMELLGKRWTVSDLIAEVAKDRAYFAQSTDGGVTASGGEATLQSAFVAAFFAGLRKIGLHTALDTCGQCAPAALEAVLPHADLVLYDLKDIDPERHAQFTGCDNRRIIENLRRVVHSMKHNGRPKELWIRTPIIPGATDRDENIAELGRFLGKNLRGVVARWDLCSFNNLCRDKYARLGLEWPYKNEPLLERATMERLAEVARGSGVDARVVHWSGAVRAETDAAPATEEGGC
jgi:pyruvate formate lyase activating enzyme